ncbi:MAG: NAD(P)/FAD-dependent oxidoreductase [Chloroflexi bacterium]|nr:NAD(P)/FAD-dependent oxidoreductase [Chloroflexota bacterium]
MLIIIGGGPSGLSTALHLQQAAPHLAPRILILEKAHYPRPKLCAGGLVVDAEIILQRLGLDVSEVPHADVDTAHFDFAGRGLSIRNPKRQTLRVIRRNEFDAWLAKKAQSRGMEIREGVTVKNILPDNEGVTVETDSATFRAQIVVGADGSNGITRKCILPNAPVYTARALEVLTPTLPSPKLSELGGGLGRGHDAYFDFFPVPANIAGYVWDFPTQVNGEAMRCWGVYDTNLLASEKRPQLKDPLAKEMSRHGFDLDEYELKGHPIRWYDPANPVSVPRVLLVGDAAGADPLFGEGISIALGYGAVAAREIGESLRRNEFSFSGYKRRLARSGLGQTLFVRWLITQVVYSFKWRWFQILLWRVLKPIVVIVAWLFVLNWSKRIR